MPEEDNTRVEQITKEPAQLTTKIKDPKKVAAGQRLASYHRKAKDALKLEENRDVIDEGIEEGSSSSWMPEISFTTVLTVIGISITSLDLYLRWKKSNQSNIKTITQPKIENNAAKDCKPSMIPVPRIGME